MIFPVLIASLVLQVLSQGQLYPQHWYGAHQGNIRSGVVPEFNPPPSVVSGTMAPHICGFNTYTRRCMDPEGYCPGKCMNFRYTYNTLYDCRCLVI
ncbi:unnamed protein product [Caenorhabditis auriculariae]|uniref:Uncharacterized protein n=1 Tax=Caenorhabditis auriculariae TaxID=2777116 RepID=A0A8S1GRG9_9PELO|nr:unnamed protein product [Caenorhabditis auriculariae]